MEIDWASISPEDFEALCISLLFREGYRNIVPLGARGVKEEGKDAIERLFSGSSKESKNTVFQFKRWTADYDDSQLKGLIKKELDEKVIPSGQKIGRYILVTCHPLTNIKVWLLNDLPKGYNFPILFFEKAWVENRLDSDSQDIRRRYFGVDVERHSFKSLKETCRKQIADAVSTLRHNYVPELYVNREIERDFQRFLVSEKPCFVLVDRSGRGKTYLLCHLAVSRSKKGPVIFIFGNKNITSENDLINRIVTEVGYAGPKGTRWQADMENLESVISKAHSTCLIIIDGISENENIVAMKNAIRELLVRYGNKAYFKFCISCRDILWTRFAEELSEYIYTSQAQQSQMQLMGNKGTLNLGITLGDWSSGELDTAIEKYTAYFRVQFSLAPDVKNQCKYPLLLRLLCETYSDQSLGLITALPLYQVFEDYLKTKIHRIADYLNLSFPPDELNLFLRRVREKMWIDNDVEEIKEVELIKMFVNMHIDKPYDVLYRMLDEGLFLRIADGDFSSIRFGFDELADYLLFLVFRLDPTNRKLKIADIIQNQVLLLKTESLKIRAEKFLVLISRSLNTVAEMDFLLENLLVVDLVTFAKCSWQRVLFESLSDKSEQEYLDVFGQALIHYYERIINTYFPELRHSFNPYNYPGEGELGLRLTSSPKFREISYSYRLQERASELVEINLTDKFPTWSLSFGDLNGKQIALHDPEHGIMIASFRGGPTGTIKILDFEWDSPFPGVSLMAPDRLALFDVRTELKFILDSHLLSEPFPLLSERAYSLSKKLPGELVQILEIDEYEKQVKEILSLQPQSRDKVLLEQHAREFLYYLQTLKDDIFAFQLPKPDLPAVLSSEPWKQYSEIQMFNYLNTLFSALVREYRNIVEKNFPKIAHRLNLFNQYPAEYLILMDNRRDHIRFFSIPTEREAGIKIINLPDDQPLNASPGKLEIDNIAYGEYVKNFLQERKRYETNSYAIDKIIAFKELFDDAPLNRLVYEWLLSDIADVLQVLSTEGHN